ncbi:MAG: hypothetical protein EOO42_02260 [Flavobacteriales bacterium]|nr:MAG: hypothetical protein EOO42_02260 [Flavobacteriales bacterium]
MISSPASKTYVAFGAVIIWFSILLQFYVSLQQANFHFIETLKLFLSFFTVTTNILLGFCLLSLWLVKEKNLGVFFSKPSTLTALTVYILVVGLIYNVLLRGLLHPTGWARIADELLHVASPLIFLGFWIFFVDKTKLAYKNALIWLIYPIAYIVFIAIRGYLINLYPYPFINVVNLGYPKAVLNAFFCVVLFLLLSILLIWIGKKTVKH